MNKDALSRMKPKHLHILFLYWKGLQINEIADIVGMSPAGISGVIKAQDATDVLNALREGTVDSMRSVDADLQAIAPALLSEKVNLALGSADEQVRTKNCTELLMMAGHNPVRRVRIERPSEGKATYGELSEQEMRDRLLKSLENPIQGLGSTPDKAPDGSPLQ